MSTNGTRPVTNHQLYHLFLALKEAKVLLEGLAISCHISGDHEMALACDDVRVEEVERLLRLETREPTDVGQKPRETGVNSSPNEI